MGSDQPTYLAFYVQKLARWSVILAVIIAALVVGRDFLIPLTIAIPLWSLLDALREMFRRLTPGAHPMPGWLAMALSIATVVLVMAVFAALAERSAASDGGSNPLLLAVTLLIVGQILKVVMDTCDKVTVLDHGQKIGEGAPSQVKDDPAVIEAYLGKEMDDDEVRELGKKCEAARSEALAPIRARKTQACIEQQLRSKGHCERYYTTYGNVSPGPTGAPQQGYFYDLPECQEWLEAREALRVSRSRP